MTYFALTFAISWGGILIAMIPGGFSVTPERFEALLSVVVVALLAGPSVAGVLLTGLVRGRAGIRELLSRSLRWRVGIRWYAVALLTIPLVTAAVLSVFSLFSPDFVPAILTTSDKAFLLLSGIGVGLMGAFLEELGWMGFAIPQLRHRYGVFGTGLLVGLLWGAWHLPTSFWGRGESAGAVPLLIYLPVMLLSFLPPIRLLMVWVYDRTGSLLMATLMHASLVASTFFVLAPPATGWAFVIYNLVLAAALWSVVAAFALAQRQVA